MKRELSNRALTICGVPVWEQGQNLFSYTGPEFLGKGRINVGEEANTGKYFVVSTSNSKNQGNITYW